MTSAFGTHAKLMDFWLQDDQAEDMLNLLTTRGSSSKTLALPSDDFRDAGEAGSHAHSLPSKDNPTMQNLLNSSCVDSNQQQNYTQQDQSPLCLVNMPPEILACICANLEAVWVYNLSHTCSKLFNSLNGPHANHIWYNVLPEALWRKRERYQVNSELNEWAMISFEKAVMLNRAILPVIPWSDRIHAIPGIEDSIVNTLHFDNHYLASSVPLDGARGSAQPSEHQSEATASSSPSDQNAVHDESILAEDATWTSTYFDNWMGPASSYVSSLQTQSIPLASFFSEDMSVRLPFLSSFSTFSRSCDVNLLPEVAHRHKNFALGGPYQPLFSYKREIVGHLSSRLRCHICFGRNNFYEKTPVRIRLWGLMWCERCLSKHTIEYDELRELVKNINRSNIGKRFVFPEEVPLRTVFTEYDEIYLMASQVSNTLVTHGCGTIKSERLLRDASIVRRTHKGKRDNAERRYVRNLIVAAAEKLWEGRCPIDRPLESGMRYLQEYSELQVDPSEFAFWRERFAPTKWLKHFLFPSYLLSEETPPFDKSAIHASFKYQYPADPLDNIHLRIVRGLMYQPAWIACQADSMLRMLVNFRDPAFRNPGYGGTCTIWNMAVRNHHQRRLEAKLDEAIRNGDLQPFSYRSVARRSTVAQRLRIEEMDIVKKAGLTEAEKQQGLRSLFAGPSMFEPYKMPVDSVYKKVCALKQQEDDFDERLRHAKKILLATCKKCPINKLNISKKGIDALLNHVRDQHPNIWWCSDDWHIVG